MPPLMCKFQKVFFWVNKDLEKAGFSSAVNLSKYNPTNNWFYTIDDKSYIKAYDLSPLHKELLEYQVD